VAVPLAELLEGSLGPSAFQQSTYPVSALTKIRASPRSARSPLFVHAEMGSPNRRRVEMRTDSVCEVRLTCISTVRVRCASALLGEC